MSSADEAAEIHGPTEGATFAQATSSTSARYEVPDVWRGRWVEATAIDQDLEIAFGDDGVEVEFEANSTVTSEAITFTDTVGGRVFSGSFRPFKVPASRVDASGTEADVTHFAIEAAGAGRVQIRLADGQNPAGK